MISRISARIRAFHDETTGTVSVEAAVIFPVIMSLFLSLFVYFEGYRQTAINHKASNTIADMLSRETEAVTPTYMDNTKALFDLLAEANNDNKIRISVVKWDEYDNEYQVDWSEARGGSLSGLTDSDLIVMAGNLPVLPDQERVVLVETWSTYQPLFNIGMSDTVIRTFVFTRLRFAPQLTFYGTDADDGTTHSDF